ncbi:MAG: hypothetical protein FWF73_07955 [Spirochaetes bacterium]|nr:hypothetical protein [Spirochaetota bacterium]
MTDIKKRKLKRIIFPIGIFFLLLLIESIIGIAGVIYLTGKKTIAEINYTISYSKITTESFANVAEFSYPKKDYAKLKDLFHKKIKSSLDEAFFVLKNCDILAHSNPAKEEKLNGNINKDGIHYNVDVILEPVYRKSYELIWDNYNITDITYKLIPFKKWEREILCKYINKDLNSTGWICSRCIFYNGEPIGTVNFIISKERIYASIRQSIDMIKYYSILIIAISAVISFLVSLIIFFRYRSIQSNALQHDNYGDYYYPIKAAPENNYINLDKDYEETFKRDFTGNDFDDFDINEVENIHKEDQADFYKPKKSHSQMDDDEFITVEFLGEIESDKRSAEVKKRPDRVKEYIAPIVNINDHKKTLNKEIRDAIPIGNKR